MAARRIPWVTIVFAVANIAVYVWSLAAGADLMHPSTTWMFEHGGNFGPITLSGEEWRLLTSMFLHYGIIHIVMNLVGLLTSGPEVERLYGRVGYAVVYVVSGLAGGLAASLKANAISAGASGAIFGVIGAFGAYLVVHRNRIDRELFAKRARSLGTFLAINIYIGLTVKGISLAAHAGGLVGGFLVGLALEWSRPGASETRSIWRPLAVAIVSLALLVGGTFSAPVPSNAIIMFAQANERLLTRWNKLVEEVHAHSMNDDQLADVIEHELLPAWQKERETFERDGRGERKDAILEYMKAREEGWRIMLPGLRAHDKDAVTRGMARFREADELANKLH